MRHDLAREIRNALTDPVKLCTNLGLTERAQRQAAGLLIRCPVHGERNPSCSVTRGPDGTVRAVCFACDWRADALGLVAAVYGLQTRGEQFREVLVAAAELGGLYMLVDEIRGERPRADRPRVPAPPPEPERDYPPAAEVARVWEAAMPATDDGPTTSWLVGRRIDPEIVTTRNLARVLVDDGDLPSWARYRGESWWRTGHRLVIRVFDSSGAARSLRACRIGEGTTPKRLPPAGHKASELVIANRRAAGLLMGRARARRVIVVEGEPDWLTASTRYEDPVFGLVSGAWTSRIAQRIPTGAEVIVWTHDDDAGERYAAQVAKTLGDRAEVWRSV